METDAVFFPLSKKKVFSKRLIVWNSREQDSQGVVFNEMKGAMSSPMEIMYRRTLNSVFPSITYHQIQGASQ